VQFVQCFKAGSLYSFSSQECIFSFFFPDVHKRSGRYSVMDEESSHFSQLENCVHFLDKFLVLRQLLQQSKLVLYIIWIILWEKDLNQRAVRQ
jgi:hypothetical protein